MENEAAGPSSLLEAQRRPSEMLKDLILRWFLETQIVVLLQDGSLPDWFHGFLTRKQTEMLLENRDFGCFLIRLNERSFGYILSYRGKDRCRHFVISCQRNGRYVVSGDTRTHQSLAELISYYQTSEIEPFGENLTSACSKLEEKSVYDEISSDRNSGAAAPTLSRNLSTDCLVARSHSNKQPGNPRIQLQEEQKSFFKEHQNSGPKEDLDAVLPVPDRSHLLKSLFLEEHVGGEGSIYSTVKKLPLDRRSLAKSKEGCRDLVDTKAKEPEGLGQGDSSPCQKKIGTVFALAKQSDTPFTKKVNPVETAEPETIYSTIALNQARSCWISAEPHGCQSSFPPSKKSGVNVPNYPPPKLSPKLLNKPKHSMEFHELQSPLGIYTTSVGDKEHGQLNQPKSLFGLAKEPMNEIYKLENHPSALWTDNTTNAHESFRWAKSIFPGSEKPPKTSPTKSKGSYEQISKKFGQPSKIQINPEDPYEKIPDLYPKGSSTTSQASTLENPYEQIPYVPGKRTEAKLTQKSDKPRRFLFAEKKAKS